MGNMKQYFVLTLLYIIAVRCDAFTSAPKSSFIVDVVTHRSPRSTTKSSTNLNMFFGAAKDDGSPGDYLCKDCGYVFTKGPAAWSKLPDKYKCPPCGAPKFRFKKVPKGSASGKVEVKKSWF